MDDRTKLTLVSLSTMMLPRQVGYSLTVIVLSAVVSIGIDMAKGLFSRHPGAR